MVSFIFLKIKEITNLLTIYKDITSIKEGIIVHQVNCVGVMGAGIALMIRDRWPKVYTEYKKWYLSGDLKLGNIQLINVEPNLYVCNLAGQYDIGVYERKTNYNAVREGFKKLRNLSIFEEMSVFIPYKMGCRLGGGNWDIYSKIIEEEYPDAIIVRFDKFK